MTNDHSLTSAACQSPDVSLDQILIATSPPQVERYVSADFAETTPQATNDVGWLSFIHNEVASTPSFSIDHNVHFGNGSHSAFLDGLPWFQFQSLLNIPGKDFLESQINLS